MPTTQHRGATNMDIEEFAKQVQPRAKRSQLDPYREQIFTLKARGYANLQIRDWLETVGIKCSQEAVRKFIKSRAEQGAVDCAIQKPPAGSTPASPSSTNRIHGDEATQATEPEPPEVGNLSLKQRGEKIADQYMKPGTTNPLLKKLKEKK